MSHQIFWDASAFVALGNKRDALHQRAVTVSRQLAQDQAQIITTSAVLTEVANGLSKVGWRTMAQTLIESTRQSAILGVAKIVHVDEQLWQRGWQMYQHRPDKEWGLTDCISFVIMTEYDIKEAFTADHHFEQAGFIRLIQI
jgi:predicted nucleic acid-binding protein